MPTGGYVEWSHSVLARPGQITNVWLEDRWWDIPAPEGISVSRGPGASVLETHAGTHRVHVPYTGTATASQRRAYTFGLRLVADSEADWYQLEHLAQSGAVMSYVPLLWVVDELRDVQSGRDYYLSRSVARTLSATGITDITHPDEYVRDGIVDPSAGSIAGNTFSATASGSVVRIRYLPYFNVVCTRFDIAIEQVNLMTASVELTEVMQ